MKYYVILFAMFYTQCVFAQVDTVGYQEAVEYEEPDESSDEYNEESSHNTLNPAAVSQKKGYTSEPIDVQRFDDAKWKKVVGDEDYLEGEPPRKKEKGGRDGDRNKRRQEQDNADSGFGGSFFNSPILNYIVYGLAIGIIAYIIFLVSKNISLKGKTKIPKSRAPDPSAPVADIKELEIDRLLREAMTAGNYRLAIRIYFLGLLKKLDENGFIIWKKDKTNRDYLTELFSKDQYFEEVRTLTLAYEEVWYGDHDFRQQTYEHIIASFKTIDQKLNASKAK